MEGTCKYGEKCNFAFNQLEIDVWTEERKGSLVRELLFQPAAVKLDPVTSIIRLVEEHRGMFLFVCQVSTDTSTYNIYIIIILQTFNILCSIENEGVQ